MDIQQQDDVTVVKLDQEYDAFSEDHLAETQRKLLQIVEGPKSDLVVLDFSDTRYFSSTFMELLVRIWDRLHRKGGRLAICSLHPYCMEILQAAKLNTLWPIFGSSEEAIKELAR